METGNKQQEKKVESSQMKNKSKEEMLRFIKDEFEKARQKLKDKGIYLPYC